MIDSQRGTNVPGRLEVAGVCRDANRIRDSIVLREISGDRRSRSDSRRTQPFGECSSPRIEAHSIVADQGFCEFQQRRAAGHAYVEFRANERLEVHVQSMFTSTLTEEPGMIESSVKTVVECGHPSGDHLGLRTSQSLVVLIIVIE